MGDSFNICEIRRTKKLRASQFTGKHPNDTSSWSHPTFMSVGPI